MRRRKRKRNLYHQIKIIEFRRQKKKRINSRVYQKFRRMMVQQNITNVQELFRTVNESKSKTFGKQLSTKDRQHQLQTPEINKRTAQPQIQHSKSTVIEGKNLFNSKIIQSPHNQHAIAARNRSKKMETEMFSPHFGSVVESDIQIRKKSINTINNKEICSFGEQSKEIFRSSLRQKILEQRNQKLVLDEQFEEIKKQSEFEESEIQKLGASEAMVDEDKKEINQFSESKLFVAPTIPSITKISEEKSSIVSNQATQSKSITTNFQNPPPPTHNNRKISMTSPSELLGQQVKEIIPSTASQNQTFQSIFAQTTDQPTLASINTLTQSLFSQPQVTNPLQNHPVPVLFMSNQKAPETSSVLAPAIAQNVLVSNPPLIPKVGGLFGSNQNQPIKTTDQTAPLIFGASQPQNSVVQSQNTQGQVSMNQNQPQNLVVPGLFSFSKNQIAPSTGLFSQNLIQNVNQPNSQFAGLFNQKAPVIQNPVQGIFSSQPNEQTILKDNEEFVMAPTSNAQQPEVKQIGLFGKDGVPQRLLFEVKGSLFQNTDDKAKIGLFQAGQQVQGLFGLNTPATKQLFGNLSDNQPKQQDKQSLFGQQQSLFNFGSKEIT